MKKLIFIIVIVSLFSSMVLYQAYAQDQDVNVILRQMEGELLHLRVPINDINPITQVLRSLLNQGATKSDLMNIILSITKKGLTGKNLYSSLESVNSLVESGAKVDEAGNIVLQAIDEGMTYGFKSEDLGLIAKVQETVEQRKMQLLDERNKQSSGGLKAR